MSRLSKKTWNVSKINNLRTERKNEKGHQCDFNSA